MKTLLSMMVAFLLATATNAQWVVTPSAPVSSYSQPGWKMDTDLHDNYMAITYGNQNPSVTPGATGTFLKIFTGINTPITGDIAVFNLGFHISRVKISNANFVYVLGTNDFSAVTKLVLKKFNTTGTLLGTLIINIPTAAEMYDLAIADNDDVLVSLFDGNDLKIMSYNNNLVYKGTLTVATGITHFSLPLAELRSQFIDFNAGHILIGYSRGSDASLTSYIKKYNYTPASPATSPVVATYPFSGGFKRSHLESLNSHQIALRSNGDVFYVNGISGVKRISGGTTTTITTNAKTKVNVDAHDNLLISWTDNLRARARLYNASNTYVHQYAEDGTINGSWAPAFDNCKFVIAGDKSNQATDYHTNRKPHYQIFNCSDCQVGGTATASAKFKFPNQVIQMNSLYGPQDVTELCLVDDLLVDGSASCNEDGYFVEITEFNLMTWTDITVLHSAWVCTGCQVPNNINIASFLPQGYQLRPDKVYRFKLAVGSPWHSVNLFFKIACCKRSIIVLPEEELPVEHFNMDEKETEQQAQTSPVDVFPNPIENNEVTLNFTKEETSGEAIISIKNFLGEEIFNTKTNEEALKIDISLWEKGIYLCTITVNEKTFTRRIIKQ
jgi:hypothetical protein